MRQRAAPSLGAAVDGDLRGVEIDRGRLVRLTPERAVQALAGTAHRAFGALAMHPTEALGDLQRGRRGRRSGDRAQRGPGTVSAQILEMVKERAADQLALRQADDQLTGRETPRRRVLTARALRSDASSPSISPTKSR